MTTAVGRLSGLIASTRKRGLRPTLSLAAVVVRSILELLRPRTIWGERIGLRPVRSSLTKFEAGQVYDWSRDVEVLQWSGGAPSSLTADEFYIQLRRQRWHPQYKQRVFYIVTRIGEHIGRVGLFTIDWDRREGELGILIAKDHWNKHYGRDAIKLLLRYVWTTTPLTRVYLNTASENLQAQRSFAACGFRPLGVGRRYIPLSGEYVAEGIHMEILRRGIGERSNTKRSTEGL